MIVLSFQRSFAHDPLIGRARVIDDLLRLEEQLDLLAGGLGAVAGVHQVELLAQPEIAADRPRRGLPPVRRSRTFVPAQGLPSVVPRPYIAGLTGCKPRHGALDHDSR